MENSRITKDFDGDLMLTIRVFGRRVFVPRETIAIAAVTSEGAQSAMIQSR